MKTTLPFAAALLALGLLGCPPPPGETGKKDAGKTDSGEPALNPYSYFELDTQPSQLKHLAMAVTADDRVGVAYFVSVDGGVPASLLLPDGGTGDATVLQNYEIRYTELADGQVSTPQVVATVQLAYGLSLAFRPNGEPAVAYLGGGSDNSVFWLQSDAAVSYRSAGNTWTEQVAVSKSAEAPCGNALSDGVGFLVGLNPGLVFDGATAYLAYRDCHNGQFPQQDWGASDLEVAIGGPGSWQHPLPPLCGGNNKQGFGGHISMVMAGAQPAVVSDKVLGSADGFGSDAIFQKRNADGTWTMPMDVITNGNNQSGPSLAWDSTLGFGVAAVERSTNDLKYTASADGTMWQAPDTVFQSGSGGWYPSLAFDPINHEPAVAFYICSPRNGVNEASCQASEDSLHVRQLIGTNWRDQLVDEEGGYLPKLGFLSTGKRVLAYRLPATGALRLALER